MHYDTVDNFHVVVGDASKSFDVISPGDLPQMYVDFPIQEEEDPTVRCPTRTTFGCDQFGCFGYVPFSASRNARTPSTPLCNRSAARPA